MALGMSPRAFSADEEKFTTKIYTGDNLAKIRDSLQGQEFGKQRLGQVFGKRPNTLYTTVYLEMKCVNNKVTEIKVSVNVEDLNTDLEPIGTFSESENKGDYDILVTKLGLQMM
jgi:hypothetical protein